MQGDDIAARLVAPAVDVVKSSESQSTPSASITARCGAAWRSPPDDRCPVFRFLFSILVVRQPTFSLAPTAAGGCACRPRSRTRPPEASGVRGGWWLRRS
jgi:hypothetical protein